MAGSKRHMRYVDDRGLVFAILADASNVEAIHLGANASAPDVASGVTVMPVAKQCRKARYQSADKLRTVTIPVATVAAIETLPSSITVRFAGGPTSAAAVDVVLSLRGVSREKLKPSIAGDTGQTAGTGG